MKKSKRIQMVCGTCGSTNVRRNGDLQWNVKTQKWEIVAIFDETSCEDCGTYRTLKTVSLSA